MKVVVGLRNPGPDYQGSRHNVGSEVVQALARRHGGRFKRGPLRLRAEFSDVRIGSERVVLAAPLSFMNESGGPVRAVLDYHKATADDLLVVYDDIDLEFGRLRLRDEGGSGGHNGLRSIERSLGSPGYARLKLGVGRPPSRIDPADYVLRPFAKAERPEVDTLVEDAADVVELWLADFARAQERAALRGRD